MRCQKIMKCIIPLLVFVSIFNCSKDPKEVIGPPANPEYSQVFSHGDGDLCYYPRISSDGQYLAIEREEIVSPPGYVAHIWVNDISTAEARQLTGNPDVGYYDDRNLRFTKDGSEVYFLRTHWRLNGTYNRTLCRIPLPAAGQNNYAFFRSDDLMK